MRHFFTPGRIFCLAIALALLGLGVAALMTDTQTVTAETSLIEAHKQGVGMLTDKGASQTFTAPENNLAAVSVMFSNYAKKVKEGTLTLQLADETGAALARQDYPVGELRNSAFVTLELPEAIADSAGRAYTLTASSDCVEHKGVTVRMGPLDAPREGVTLTLADGSTDTENAMNLRLVYRTTAYGWMAAMTCWLVALCFAACVPLAGGKERRHA